MRTRTLKKYVDLVCIETFFQKTKKQNSKLKKLLIDISPKSIEDCKNRHKDRKSPFPGSFFTCNLFQVSNFIF